MSLKNIDDDKKLVKEDEPIIGDDPNSSNDSSNKDINKNLGKFDKKNVSPYETKINPLHKVNIDQQKINFAKFETKKTNLLTKHKFFENFGVILNKKKWCITIILIEFFLMSLFIGVASFLIKNIKPLLGHNGLFNGPMNFSYYQKMGKVGYIFCIICICPFALPLLYLISSFFIGINLVLISKSFHLFFIFTILLSFLMFFFALVFTLIPLFEHWGFVKG